MVLPPVPVLPNSGSGNSTPWPLHGVAASQALERAQAALLPPNTLMQRAGQSVARLALALAPHARQVWIACGPGNNGGDGLEAAAHLQQMGKTVHVTWLGDPARCPADTQAAWVRAREAGLIVEAWSGVPSAAANADLCIDALLGLGSDLRARPLSDQSPLGQCVEALNAAAVRGATVLAVDLPTGLEADTGHVPGLAVRATHTVSLLTLKPGLFTAHGRDHAGAVWFDDLSRLDDPPLPSAPADALLTPRPAPAERERAAHVAHKGSFGQVQLIGGAGGMQGAALLAARAAQRMGAGKVFVALLAALEPASAGAALTMDPIQPELMFRPPEALDLTSGCTVIGCGGGTGPAHAQWLARVLSQAPRLVVDADALNLIAIDASLQTLMSHRATRGMTSVLTPHPLEAARLLACSVADVQSNRLAAAGQLAARFQAVVVLKGSGSVVAAPGLAPWINPSGDARLATAGTGDVLAGMVGGALAQQAPAQGDGAWRSLQAWVAAVVHRHGDLPARIGVQSAQAGLGLTASSLLNAI